MWSCVVMTRSARSCQAGTGGLEGDQDAEAVGLRLGPAHLPHPVRDAARPEADGVVAAAEDAVPGLEDGGLPVGHPGDLVVGLPLTRAVEAALDLEGDA